MVISVLETKWRLYCGCCCGRRQASIITRYVEPRYPISLSFLLSYTRYSCITFVSYQGSCNRISVHPSAISASNQPQVCPQIHKLCPSNAMPDCFPPWTHVRWQQKRVVAACVRKIRCSSFVRVVRHTGIDRKRSVELCTAIASRRPYRVSGDSYINAL